MRVKRYHVERSAIDGDKHIIDDTIPVAKLKSDQIQKGTASLTFPFAAAGVETHSATVTFPKSFPTGKVPILTITPADNVQCSLAVTARTETDFTVTASDNLGIDLTSSITVDILWIAIVP